MKYFRRRMRFCYGFCVGLALGAVPAGAQASYTVLTPPGAQSVTAGELKQTHPVTVVVHDSTVAYVMGELIRDAHVHILFNEANPLFAKRITVRVINKNVRDALKIILKGTGLVGQIAPDGETIVVHPQSETPPRDSANRVAEAIAGYVTDSATGKGIEGVRVAVQGTKLSTLTSQRGHFSLRNVPVGKQVLTFKAFGYKPVMHSVKVMAGHPETLQIVLTPMTTVLSGVVTTATGQQQRFQVGNDITTINVDSVMQVAPITSITDLLETRVPGLEVQHTSGTPGDPSRIRIRGASSINSTNDPIVIVDGVRVYAEQSTQRIAGVATRGTKNSSGISNSSSDVDPVPYAKPSPLDQIDPNAIEKIEVFKGPSASALYGSDAANGVIIITTKRGRAGPPHWAVVINQGVSYLPGAYPASTYRFGHGVNGTLLGSKDMCLRTGFSRISNSSCVLDSIVSFQALNDPRYSILGTGTDSRLSTTVDGGVKELRYSLTGSGSTTLGILRLPDIEATRFEMLHGFRAPDWMQRPDRYRTWGANGTLTAQLGKTGTVTASSGLYHSTQQRSSLETALRSLMATYVDRSQIGQQPLINEFYERVTADALTSNSALTLSLPLLSWLPLHATLGLNTVQSTQETLLPRDYTLNRLLPLSSQRSDTSGHFSIAKGTVLMKTVGFNTTIPMTRHGAGLRTALGFNFVQQSRSDLTLEVNALPLGVNSPSSFVQSGCANDDCNPRNLQQADVLTTFGWFLEPTINLNSRLFVKPGIRLDGGSNSGNHAGLTGFPKVSVSWLVSDEAFFPLKDLMNPFRVRAAYGYAGVQPGPADRLRLIRPRQESLDGGLTYVDILTISQLGNTQLRPERSRELEIGFDADFLDGRLQVGFSNYRKTRLDAILDVSVAPSVNGGGSFRTNIGVVRNTGMELSVTVQSLQQAMLGWTVSAMMSDNRNIVVNLAPGVSALVNGERFTLSNSRIIPGYPLNGRWALPIRAFADANKDGVIDRSEIVLGDSLVYMGAETPNYNLSVNPALTLFRGRVSVSATVDYQNGLTQMNFSGTSEAIASAANASLGQQAAIVATQGLLHSVVVPQTAYGLIQTVNTLRFNSLSINYAVSSNVSRLLRAHSMTIAVQGRNLGLWTNYQGKDPNVNAFATGDLTRDTGQLPQPRIWSLQMRLGI